LHASVQGQQPAAGTPQQQPGVQSGSGQQQQQQCSQLGLAAHVVPHSAVMAFVWSVIRHVVPVRLLGSRHNRRVLRRAVDRVVRGRRHEVVRLQECLRGLKTTQMPWLMPPQHTAAASAAAGAAARPAAAAAGGGATGRATPSRSYQPVAAAAAAAQAAGASRGTSGLQQQQQQSRARSGVPLSQHLARQRVLSCWVWWALVHLVLPLLRNNFYVTESEPYRQVVFYYRFVCLFLNSWRGLGLF
jgi:hypothetical protein